MESCDAWMRRIHIHVRTVIKFELCADVSGGCPLPVWSAYVLPNYVGALIQKQTDRRGMRGVKASVDGEVYTHSKGNYTGLVAFPLTNLHSLLVFTNFCRKHVIVSLLFIRLQTDVV